MEKMFGSSRISVIEMPSGQSIQAEVYSEFGRAFDILRDTKKFNEMIADLAGETGKVVVFLEGETDPEYLRSAAELLNYSHILDQVEFVWVGMKDKSESGATFSGKSALDKALAFLRANLRIFDKRTFIFLYDNDAKKKDEDFQNIHVRCLPLNAENRFTSVGIENLLVNEVFSDIIFEQNEYKKPDGSTTIVRKINKHKMMDLVCTQRRTASDFVHFSKALDLIDGILKACKT
jgi:hypothetical protein